MTISTLGRALWSARAHGNAKIAVNIKQRFFRMAKEQIYEAALLKMAAEGNDFAKQVLEMAKHASSNEKDYHEAKQACITRLNHVSAQLMEAMKANHGFRNPYGDGSLQRANEYLSQAILALR
jgi:hypothetical protein